MGKQFEKMLAGEMYNDTAPEMIEARRNAVRLAKEYNESYEKSQQEREAILRRMMKSVGQNVHLEPEFRCEFGCNITIGDHFWANLDCVMLDCAEIVIGDHVLFGPRVGIYTANHAVDAWERINGACYAKPVKIGNNVWVGAGVHITPGVTIGDNTIIGAGSVVTKDIPANVIAAGVPCRVIREITEADKTGYRPD